MLSDMQARVVQELRQQVRFAGQALEVSCGERPELVDGGQRRVQQGELHAVVALLLGIELGCVPGQPFEAKVARMAGKKGPDAFGPMRGQPVPHDDQRPADAAAKMPEADDHFSRPDAREEMARIDCGRRAVEGRRQRDETRDDAALRRAGETGGAADGRPRGGYAGPKRETRFVQEGNDVPAPTSPFLMRGQSRASHAAINSSFRSRARVVGRCGDQP